MSAPLLRVPGPVHTDLPTGVSVDKVLVDLADDQVAAPPEYVDRLVAEVQRARDNGIDLSVVVLDEDPRVDSQLRDLATEVGVEDGGTVLVLSPGWVGTYSDSLDRVTLEAAQDRTYTGDPVVSTRNFVDSVLEPSPPWTGITLVLVLLVALVGGATYWAKVRRSRHEQASEHRAEPPQAPTKTL
ncbi:hypothetical protein OED52_09920 [Rhodococcus sp. Z13]|uniref:Uncharacterized protein n=1 Tax=Rhodococcus sacchari TaxID=2962047 RepID=A0ACD4DL74_9NOCA|nr:DUF6676 family protein [Rhodococcus sp. Z13]UYP20799.1 hypothetical protein OED52_09920 [Rhodococcus sp. Z13]